MTLLCADIVHSINTWPNQSKFQITTAHRANLPTITEIFSPQLECGLTKKTSHADCVFSLSVTYHSHIIEEHLDLKL